MFQSNGNGKNLTKKRVHKFMDCLFDDLTSIRKKRKGPVVIFGLQINPFMKGHNLCNLPFIRKTPVDKEKFIIKVRLSTKTGPASLRIFAANIIKPSCFHGTHGYH